MAQSNIDSQNLLWTKVIV